MKCMCKARKRLVSCWLALFAKKNRFDHAELKEVMDLCLSCKACKSECPSGVDVAKMKAEFLQHYHDANGASFRSAVIAHFTKSQQLGSSFAPLYNAVVKTPVLANPVKRLLGFAPERSLPTVDFTPFSRWMKKQPGASQNMPQKRKVYLFGDEFTEYNDTAVGIAAHKLLTGLGYAVEIPRHVESGRTYLSKGFVKRARKTARTNIELLQDVVSAETPLLGIEPSAIITFRDEYVDLVPPDLRPAAQRIAANTLMFDEFLAREAEKGHIRPEQFTSAAKRIKLHGHCYQKAFHLVDCTKKLLSLPRNYEVEVIPSGCCGMAGSFGYEKEHYGVSMKVAELVLLPAVRETPEDVLIAAAGTSCRHQIKDGTGRKALHPAEILCEALL